MDNEDNFLSVISNTDLQKLLSPEETMRVQSKLWDALSRRADSYQRGGSSSIRMETAQELLKSTGFVLRYGINAVAAHADKDGIVPPEEVKARLLGDDYEMLFKAGLCAIEKLVKEGENLLDTVKMTAIAVNNRAYDNTLKALGVFFKRYHYHHFAHDIPCMIDYPLAHPVDESLLGIEWISEYLRRLIIENEFCGFFDAGIITALLRSAAPNYQEDLLNIFETVAANAIGLTLLGGDVVALDITEQDRSRLADLISAWTAEEAPVKLSAVSSGLCAILDVGTGAAAAYLAQTAEEIYARIKPILPLGHLEHIFPSLYRDNPQTQPTIRYIDGAAMDDEQLRALIDTITSCRHVADKIALARRYIGSLRDWEEILGICFWGEERTALFASFGKDEIGLLLRYVREKQRKYPEWVSETGWENALLDFTKG